MHTLPRLIFSIINCMLFISIYESIYMRHVLMVDEGLWTWVRLVFLRLPLTIACLKRSRCCYSSMPASWKTCWLCASNLTPSWVTKLDRFYSSGSLGGSFTFVILIILFLVIVFLIAVILLIITYCYHLGSKYFDCKCMHLCKPGHCLLGAGLLS